MKIPEDPDDAQNRLKGKLAGSKGESFIEITDYYCNPEHSELFKKFFDLLGGLPVKIPIKKTPKPMVRKVRGKKK